LKALEEDNSKLKKSFGMKLQSLLLCLLWMIFDPVQTSHRDRRFNDGAVNYQLLDDAVFIVAEYDRLSDTPRIAIYWSLSISLFRSARLASCDAALPAFHWV
jgi:hypothetical protein